MVSSTVMTEARDHTIANGNQWGRRRRKMRCRACGLERSAVAVAGLSLANVGVLSWSATVLCMTPLYLADTRD